VKISCFATILVVIEGEGTLTLSLCEMAHRDREVVDISISDDEDEGSGDLDGSVTDFAAVERAPTLDSIKRTQQPAIIRLGLTSRYCNESWAAADGFRELVQNW
jgi:hypothetical protein